MAQRLVSLPIGTAMLFRAGETPRILKVDNVVLPTELTDAEYRLLDEIRHNVGHPMSEIGANLSPLAVAPAEKVEAVRNDAEHSAAPQVLPNAAVESTDESGNQQFTEADA